MRLVTAIMTDGGPLLNAALESCLRLSNEIVVNYYGEAPWPGGYPALVKSGPWPGRFDVARQYLLCDAGSGGWALMLDTDQVLHINGFDVRGYLKDLPADVNAVITPSADGSWTRERWFRLPWKGQWVGRTHECPIVDGPKPTMPVVSISDVPKSKEQLDAKYQRDLALLKEQIQEEPENARWHYYLGDVLQYLGRHPDAIASYLKCAELSYWDEEQAWACYRAAECWIALGSLTSAIRLCAYGLSFRPESAELPWLAAVAEYRLGRYKQSVSWAKMSIAIGGLRKGCGFAYLPAYSEGPYDVLRFAYKALGEHQEAANAEAMYNLFTADRLRRE